MTRRVILSTLASMPAYATPADLYIYGIPAAALQSLPPAMILEQLEGASRLADEYLKSRYTMPLVSWSSSLTAAVCKIAAYGLIGVRGFNPGAGADVNLRMRHDDAMSWLKAVSRQEVHPEVVDSVAPATKQYQPKVLSKERRT